MIGTSQAVRLPKGFRFDTDEVLIKRIGSAVLLLPKNAAWELMGEALGQTDKDFMAERFQPAAVEKRKPIDARKKKRA
jgi:antitoxin VapB